jgi:hypothetical protein
MSARPSSSKPDAEIQTRTLRADVRERWPKFSESDVAALTNTGDLVSQLEAKYGMTTQQAERAAHAFAKGRVF